MLIQTITPKSIDELFALPVETLAECVRNAVYFNADTETMGYSPWEYMLPQILWMLKNYILSRPREELLTPKRQSQIEAALLLLRQGRVVEGWIDIWHSIRFMPTWKWEEMRKCPHLERVLFI